MRLGIDIGTSKVAAVVVDETGELLATATVPTNADSCRTSERAEQDGGVILAAVDSAVTQLPSELRRRVKTIGLTGQMHGVILSSERGLSPLVTWEDGRCNAPEFRAWLDRQGAQLLKSGFGCATLAWFAQNDPELLAGYRSAGTIQDLLAAQLIGSERMSIDPSNAASWGCFSITEGKWDLPCLAMLGISSALLPDIRPGGRALGQLVAVKAKQWGLNSTVIVCNPIGDNQASVAATLTEPRDEVVITLGTGGQLSAVVQRFPNELVMPQGSEVRPYLGGEFLIVAASLCGGSAMRWLVDSLSSMMTTAGGQAPDAQSLYALLNERGNASFPGTLTITTSLRGERHDPSCRGTIEGLTIDNFNLGELAAATARGIVSTLVAMFPRSILDGKQRIVASGNAVRKMTLLRRAIEAELRLPVVIATDCEEAAFGAAITAQR